MFQKWTPKEYILSNMQNPRKPCERSMQKQSGHLAKELPMAEIPKQIKKSRSSKKYKIKVSITWKPKSELQAKRTKRKTS